MKLREPIFEAQIRKIAEHDKFDQGVVVILNVNFSYRSTSFNAVTKQCSHERLV